MEHTATGAAVALSPTLSPLAPSSLHARAEGWVTIRGNAGETESANIRSPTRRAQKLAELDANQDKLFRQSEQFVLIAGA